METATNSMLGAVHARAWIERESSIHDASCSCLADCRCALSRHAINSSPRPTHPLAHALPPSPPLSLDKTRALQPHLQPDGRIEAENGKNDDGCVNFAFSNI